MTAPRRAAIGGHLAAFDACYRRHLAEAPEHADNMRLKRDHCLRVLDEARAITAALGPHRAPDAGLVRTIHLAALYHDVGRFEQLRRYGTFDDSRSESHGALGVRAIRHCALLDAEPARAARVVRAVVALHNRRDVPAGLPSDVALALDVVRDADKLDILTVMLGQFRSGRENKVVTLGMEAAPDKYTSELLDDLWAGRPGRYEAMRYENDFRMLLLSWVFGMNFAASRRAFLERGHVRALVGMLPRGGPFAGLADYLEARLAE